MGKERNTDGRFTPEYTDAEILAAVRAHEPAATSEVAGELDMTRQGADRRLRLLRDDGRVSSKKIGASLVWFAPDQAAVRDAGGVSDDGERYPTSSDESQERGVTATAESPANDALDDALRGWETDTQADSKVARAQTRRAATYLRDRPHERFTRRELQDALAADCELSDRGWWERAVRPGLMHLSDAALVEYRAGYYDYTWSGGSEGE
jgi:hypothetical protein